MRIATPTRFPDGSVLFSGQFTTGADLDLFSSLLGQRIVISLTFKTHQLHHSFGNFNSSLVMYEYHIRSPSGPCCEARGCGSQNPNASD